jgi:predicted dehydrogenase
MLRVALVGCGGMAGLFRKVYTNLPQVEWTLAVDVSDKELNDCRALGAKRTSKNFADALAPDIDFVDVSTPNHLHEEQAIAALNAGKHVMLQKPMANNLEAADRIVAAAQKSKGMLAMYMTSHTSPMCWAIKQLLKDGALGKIQSIRARDAHRGGLNAVASEAYWRNSREKTGGGCFIQLSIHAVNMMQWWLDSAVSEVTAFSANQHCPNIGGDDVTTAAVKFDSGVLGMFDSGYASAGGGVREIYGTKGFLRATREQELELELDEPYESEAISYKPGAKYRKTFPSFALDDVSNTHNQTRMFVESILAKKPPHMGAQQGRHDLAVIVAAYESAERGCAVKVNRK